MPRMNNLHAMRTRRGERVHLLRPGTNRTLCGRENGRRMKMVTLIGKTTCQQCRGHSHAGYFLRRPIEIDETEHGEAVL